MEEKTVKVEHGEVPHGFGSSRNRGNNLGHRVTVLEQRLDKLVRAISTSKKVKGI